MKNQQNRLTEQESAFAAEHHSLIYHYLSERNLPEDEYYDVVVFGYLNGVRKHFRRGDLKSYAFTTIAWSAMNSSYASYERSKSCPKNNAQILSIHEPYRSAYALEEMIADAKDYAEETIRAIALKETLQGFEQTEREILKLLMEGYPKAEIRRVLGLTAEALNEAIASMQNKTLGSPLMQAA